MVFSKQFLQGQIIGLYPNTPLNKVRIFFYKGKYIAQIFSDTQMYLTGKENVLASINSASNSAGKIVLDNGFTLSDLDKCASTSELVSLFNIGPANAWYDYVSLGIIFPQSGTIEQIAIDDPLLAPILAYCVKLRKILKDNGIAFPGLEGVNF